VFLNCTRSKNKVTKNSQTFLRATQGHVPKQYTPIVQGTDLFALLAAAVGNKTTIRDALYHDLEQLWRTGVFGAPQAAETFEKVALDVIGLSRADASKCAVVMMGADALAGVIHGLVYTSDDGSERRGFAVGRTAEGALRVRALHTVAELLGCESAATSSELLKKAARAARTICARPSEERHWFLYDCADVELIVGVDEVEVPVEHVLSPIIVVCPSYLPLLLGECAASRLHVFELGVGGGDDGLAPYPHPSLERRLEAIPGLVFGTDGARAACSVTRPRARAACSVARPRARAACSSARDRVRRRAAPLRRARRDVVAGADAYVAVQEQIKAAVRAHAASGQRTLSPATISIDMSVRNACTLGVWTGLEVPTGRGPLRLGGEYDGGADLVATDLGGTLLRIRPSPSAGWELTRVRPPSVIARRGRRLEPLDDPADQTQRQGRAHLGTAELRVRVRARRLGQLLLGGEAARADGVDHRDGPRRQPAQAQRGFPGPAAADGRAAPALESDRCVLGGAHGAGPAGVARGGVLAAKAVLRGVSLQAPALTGDAPAYVINDANSDFEIRLYSSLRENALYSMRRP
jgi:hypothetical protein